MFIVGLKLLVLLVLMKNNVYFANHFLSGDRVRIPIYLGELDIAQVPSKRTGIEAAVADYKKFTCIDFVESRNRPTQTHYINFINDRGCYSYLGRTG